MSGARRRAGTWLALLALAVQLAAASVVLPTTMPAAGVERLVAASICHPAGEHDKHPPPACVLCPLCQAIAHAGAILTPPVFALFVPHLPTTRTGLPPPARAPPARAVAAAYPRGPPVPV